MRNHPIPRVAGEEAPYNGSDLDPSHTIPNEALIRCHKSGAYYEKKHMVKVGGGWVHRDLVDFDPITGGFL